MKYPIIKSTKTQERISHLMNNYIKKNTKKQGKQTTEKLLKQQGFNTVEESINKTQNNILAILG